MLDHLKDKHIVLASKSPRRQELLKGLDIDFEIRTKEIDEVYPDDLEPEKVPEYLSELKAKAFQDELNENDILITSDTIVILDGEILEKPVDRADAIRMISLLSNAEHTVVTGVCILSKNQKELFSDHTQVHFEELSHEEIEYYVDNYKPYDKAGSYGVQDWIGYVGIRKLEGSYFNVMGFPLRKVYRALKEF